MGQAPPPVQIPEPGSLLLALSALALAGFNQWRGNHRRLSASDVWALRTIRDRGPD